jgi:hypothetical protein
MDDPIISVFVSYSSKDKRVASDLVKALRRSKARIWFDAVSITPGATIIEDINRGVEKAHILVLLVSKYSVDSDWVKYEWNLFLDHRLRSKAPVFLIPVTIGNAVPPSPLLRYRGIKLANSRAKKELVSAVHALALKHACEQRGFETLSSHQVDRIVNKSTCILRQTTSVNPLSCSMTSFDCYHWQDAEGRINLVRHDVLDQSSGKVIPHTVRIKEKSAHGIRFQYRFKFPRLSPVMFVHEIRCENYFPNLFVNGHGYSEFFVRYPMENFSYSFLCPNKPTFAGIRVTINRKKRQAVRVEIAGGERLFSYRTKGVKMGDKLRFVINNARVRKK